MVKSRLCSFAYWAVVSLRRPVVPSIVARARIWYLLNALLAMGMGIVPVSTIPAVFPRMFAPDDPYAVDWSMTQQDFAGETDVIGVYMIELVVLARVDCAKGEFAIPS